ncbi:MAG: sensor histidine kinase KdpD [Myxococcaceae bacterium]|nr:sensor histidine kinase KdpD [Myxococcaceae bacterium]
MEETPRPDPDALLRRVQEEARATESKRGQLKIFFGFAPGVGKTFSMLESARRLKAAGTEVVVGCVETHGRIETAKQLDGLEVLPRRRIEHRGVKLEEFDLDAALARKPRVLLVDELAHTNAPGSRHARRYSDVLELLDAGIDVHTTLNVQHVESLNDVIRQLTGVEVRETVPDSVLDRAADIELIDLPPDELLGRLEAGKVYLGEQAERASRNFFQRPNLIGLRELALRRTAERVDADLARLREQQLVRGVAASGERVLVLVGTAPSSANVIRAGRRLAQSLHATWSVVWVDNPTGVAPAGTDLARLDHHLRLAESLGASVQRVTAPTVAQGVADVAERLGARHVVLGAPLRKRLRDRFRRSVLDSVLSLRPGAQVHVVSDASEWPAPPATQPRSIRASGVVAACGVVVLATAVGYLLRGIFTLQDQIMLYLVGIMVTASLFDRVASLVASTLAVAAYDFFFVPPVFTFSVDDARHALTFAMMFAVGLVISGLTLRVRRSEQASRDRENRTAALYALSRELTQTLEPRAMAVILARRARDVFGVDAGVVLDPHGAAMELQTTSGEFSLGSAERAVVRWVLDHGRPAGRGTETLPGSEVVAFPLIATTDCLGALVLLAKERGLEPGARDFVDAFVQPAALALERAQLSVEAQRASVKAEGEQLRTTLLRTVSHDLRTPLAAITGAATTLKDSTMTLPESERHALLESIEDESARLERLIGNLLDMTRLDSGTVTPRREWVPVDEVVGAALSRVERVLGKRPVRVEVKEGTPPLHVDPVLFEQVFLNLFENAAKYTSGGSGIDVEAQVEAGSVQVTVKDRGPGIAPGHEECVFEPFVFGSVGHGAGLGLAIVRSIVRVHGGSITASRREGGGACFTLRLPLERPPA